jgi:hypothetical protein
MHRPVLMCSNSQQGQPEEGVPLAGAVELVQFLPEMSRLLPPLGSSQESGISDKNYTNPIFLTVRCRLAIEYLFFLVFSPAKFEVHFVSFSLSTPRPHLLNFRKNVIEQCTVLNAVFTNVISSWAGSSAG